ncbi:MAG TPA: hypothetical protein VHF90_01905 [Thermoleophilaceae bacterium]|nr:hypothetical protein [Thermoleophilaceae bacterium]
MTTDPVLERDDEAGAEVRETPATGGVNGWVVFASIVAVILGYLLALYLNGELKRPNLQVGSDFSVFAIFYIVAQAVERLLEPFATLIGGETKEKAKQQADDANEQQAVTLAVVAREGDLDDLNALNAAGDTTEAAAALTDAASRKQQADAVLARIRANRVVWLWAAATVIGLAASGALGLYFVQTVATPAAKPPPEWLNEVDILITGLVIGAGTKPIHDLITRLQKAKENAGG